MLLERMTKQVDLNTELLGDIEMIEVETKIG
jgi:hypothetical protein